ncbi:FKBP-type peptidyl-prolyl cis-trans isomerase [Pseudenhygromyxa sp. WMMC2535]|uniref:FKBP-type peptidyl-prolyl cis-trans isomerase n=1 Tax=Pseudenhygromyxa sp. WMMC2535 TaxID=2712867 RepID=UPI00155567EA|nr:FKBP-type peptidyl-prolyl cis-trans isomerase [Pseudenhygromyxa sp. WMMC2535]NVB37185.1 FKBP-type peptidyl-prolyl cis-trans isomerase [Pseudenhygromyxa sp. WMMC2535]
MQPLRLAPTALALLALACAKDPAPAAAYQGEPAAVVSETCDPASLRDTTEGRACVFIERFASGEGPEAARGQWVRVHYVALLPGGAQLDSSHGDKPLYFKLGHSNDVISGVHEGVEGMQVGERRRITVPPKLGYRGRKLPGVPPDANLTFLVELVDLAQG